MAEKIYTLREIKECLYNAIVTVVKEIKETDIYPEYFRTAVFGQMIKDTPKLKDYFGTIVWESVETNPEGILLVKRDYYIEDMLEEALDRFIEEYKDLVFIFKKWVEPEECETGGSCQPKVDINYDLPIDLADRDADKKIETKANKMLLKYSKEIGISPLRLKMKMPPIYCAQDIIDWIEEQRKNNDEETKTA